ncbi:MAG: hypothetical protein GXO88_15135 [Chlorobi bacterium]|nr:hypothetical protein [Chlorobiota bacterium]
MPGLARQENHGHPQNAGAQSNRAQSLIQLSRNNIRHTEQKGAAHRHICSSGDKGGAKVQRTVLCHSPQRGNRLVCDAND